MKNAMVKTPFMVEEDRMVAAFAAEMERFGLEADTCVRGGHYIFDEKLGRDVFILELHTKPFPVAGNSEKMSEVAAAGYRLDVFAPYGWNRRRGFQVIVNRPVFVREEY